MNTSTQPTDLAALPVVVVGGPVGLAAAPHLADRGRDFVVLEAGRGPGATVRRWGHIRTFTPWRYLTDPTTEKLLAATGWSRPATPVPPTGTELVEHYLHPLAALVAGRTRYGHRVPVVSGTAWTGAAAWATPTARSCCGSATTPEPWWTCVPAR